MLRLQIFVLRFQFDELKGKIPLELYWKRPDDFPRFDELTRLCVKAGKCHIQSFSIEENQHPITLKLFIHTKSGYFMSIRSGEAKEKQHTDYLPRLEMHARPQIELFEIPLKLNGTATYHLVFHNESSWFQSIDVQYAMRFVNDRGESCEISTVESA